MSDGHHVEIFKPRHFDDVTEIWCPKIDETKCVLGYRYVRHCPMCGNEIVKKVIYND